jgi:single-stranded-DNA-specific exonuclease
LKKNIWKILSNFDSDQSELTKTQLLLEQLLRNRGLSDSKQFDLFLSGDSRLQGDPFQLPDMNEAVSRIYRGIMSAEKMAVYGDFDADGITGTALLVEGLQYLGASVIPHIPHRLNEGYGLRTVTLRRLREQGITLCISVDCGISALQEVREARRFGMDIVVTDHHVPLSQIPEAVAVVNPKRNDSIYPFQDLAGVGVAYKLLQSLLWGRSDQQPLLNTLDLVAMGTVSDMSPLLGENRYLVKAGLETINQHRRIGIDALLQVSGRSGVVADAATIGWSLAPRLNAAGRLDEAVPSYDLLMTRSVSEARRLAEELESKNAERQRLTQSILDMARNQLVASGAEMPVLMAGAEEYPSGVVGLVAGRLMDEFYRPVFIVKTGEKVCRGSGRSIPEFNLVGALDKCADLLVEYGGHARAAGFSVKRENLEALRERLSCLASEKLKGVELRPRLIIDVEIPLKEVGWHTWQTIQRLAPFGAANPVPVFLSRNVMVLESRTMGEAAAHLRLKLKGDNATWKSVGFGMGKDQPASGSLIDIVYSLEIDRWNGDDTLRLNLLDFKLSR